MNDIDKFPEVAHLYTQLQNAQLPVELKERSIALLQRILLAFKFGGNMSQLDIISKYVDYIVNLPWYRSSTDILDIDKVKKILDEHHYGLNLIKDRIIEYISILKLHKEKGDYENFRSPILFFVGLAGTGKSTIAPSIAEALGREFYRIPFGGLSSALDLRGQSKTTGEAEPGSIIKALRQCKTNNPVILLDELDRVNPESKGAIMGVLLELLDPNQNKHFTDYFIDYPFDLSRVLFIATANNTKEVSTAVLDRMELIHMPNYTDEEKVHIAKAFVLPKALKNAGLTEQVLHLEDEIWPIVIRPLGFESGIRGVEKMIEDMVRKVARITVEKHIDTLFITKDNVHDFFTPPMLG